MGGGGRAERGAAYAAAALVAGCVGCAAAALWLARRRGRRRWDRTARRAECVVDLIGGTPLLRIDSLSKLTGCDIYGKAEFLNPGGSIKDRVALGIVREALADGRLPPGGTVFEGTAGSTGVSLAMVASALGCRCHVVMPDDAAIEKCEMLHAYGAEVERVRPVSIAHPDHFVNVARRRASHAEGGFFSDQFENPANFRAHLATGEEIWEQTGGRIDAFIAAAGTGGTIAGVAASLKARSPRTRIVLVAPPGSSLYNRVKRGVLFSPVEQEGKRLKNPFDTITEGIGINRLTSNFKKGEACIDDAVRGTDEEAVRMARWLTCRDGLFVGSSSAMNCVGALKVHPHAHTHTNTHTDTDTHTHTHTHTHTDTHTHTRTHAHSS